MSSFLEEYVNEVNEYVPYLTSHQHFVDNLDEEEEEEEDTESIHKTKHYLLSLNNLFIQGHCISALLICHQSQFWCVMCNVPLCCNSNRNCLSIATQRIIIIRNKFSSPTSIYQSIDVSILE